MDKQIKIWSRRFTPARGNHWQEERACKESELSAWLAIFRCDEPKVIFVAQARKPAN